MASETVSVVVEIVSKVKEAQKGLDETAKKVGKFQSAVKTGAKIAAAGLLAVGGAAMKLAEKAAEDQKSAALLSNTLKNTTGATNDQVDAMEDWITKQGDLYGVTKDQLRPAIETLARSTGSLTKSQKLAKLAMDISAGTGKSLSSVTMALGKAYSGNVGGLGRLGVATKDAAGNTKTFTELQGELTQKFKGDAAKAAQTASGQYQILKVRLDEAGVTIGKTLLPILTKLIGFIATQVMPKVEAFSDWISTNTGKVKVIAGVIGALAAVFIATSAAMKVQAGVSAVVSAAAKLLGVAEDEATISTVAHTAAQKIAAGASKAYAAAQWLVNAAMDANPITLVVIAIVALVAAFVIAYKKSTVFRDIVTKAFGAVKDTVLAVVNWFKGPFVSFFTTTLPGVFTKGWTDAKTKTISVVGAIITWIKGIPQRFVNNLKTLGGKLGGAFHTAWTTAKTKTITVAQTIVTWVKALPGKLINQLRTLGGKLGGAFHTAWTTAKTKTITIVQAIATWVKGIPTRFVNNMKALGGRLGTFFHNAWTTGKNRITGTVGTIISYIRGLPGRFTGALGNLGNTLGTFFHNAFITAKNKLGTAADTMITLVKGLPARIKRAAKGVFDGLKSAALAPFKGIATLWNDTLGKISFSVPSWVPHFGGKGWGFPTIDVSAFAKGGIVRTPTIALIGENGPEAVVPLNAQGGIPGQQPYVDQRTFITVNGALDPDAVARQIKSLQTQAERRRGGITVTRRAAGRAVTTGGA